MRSRRENNRFHLKTVALSRATSSTSPCPAQTTKSLYLSTHPSGIVVPVDPGTVGTGDPLGSSKLLSKTQSNQPYLALEKHLLAKWIFYLTS